MDVLTALIMQYNGGPAVPVRKVTQDYFPGVSERMFVKACKTRKVPAVAFRMYKGHKSPYFVYLSDLATVIETGGFVGIDLDEIRPGRQHLPYETRRAVYKRDGRKCAYCDCTKGPFQIDHIHPVSKGGGDELENLTVACEPCNRHKRDKTLDEWKGRA